MQYSAGARELYFFLVEGLAVAFTAGLAVAFAVAFTAGFSGGFGPFFALDSGMEEK